MDKLLKLVQSRGLYLFLIGFIVWIAIHWGLISNQFIFSHDSYYWFSINHFFTDSVWSGFFPLWNPYLHAGEIFFDKIGHIALIIDPINFIGIFIGKLLKVKDLFYIYQTITLFRLIVIATGVQLLFNELVPEVKKYSYFTFFVLLLSSFTINSYHQNGTFMDFSYFPFILLFFVRFLKNASWLNTVLLGYFAGISFQGVHFSFISTFVILFTVSFLAFNRDYLPVLLKNKFKILAAFIIFLVLSAPGWSLMFYKGLIDPYNRNIFNNGETGIFIPYEGFKTFVISKWAFGNIGDFLSIGFLPLASINFLRGIIPGFTTEMNMFIAFIPFVLGIIGMVFAKHRLKPVFFLLLFISGALFIGPIEHNYVYMLLYYLLPLLRTIEQTAQFSTYFLFCYVFFICIGIVFISQRFNKKWLIAFLFMITLLELSLYARLIYSQRTYMSVIDRNVVTQTRNIDVFQPFEYQAILDNIKNEKDRDLVLSSYYQDKYKNAVFLSSIVSENDFKKLKEILDPFMIKGINFDSNPNFELKPRAATIMPNFISSISLLENTSDVYFLHCEDYRCKFNFRPLIQKTPTASDFYANFQLYNYTKYITPMALTYPKYYADILRAGISDGLKSKLLGVELPNFDFYTEYISLNPEEILNPYNQADVEETLSDKVILSGIAKDEIVLAENKEQEPAQIKVLKYNPNGVKLEVIAESDGILLFRDGYHPCWVGKVDGKEQKVIRANYNSKALHVKKGEHIVEFIFQPKIYMMAIGLYFIGSVGMLIFLGAFLIRKIKRNK